MNVIILASGSKGNATYIETPSTKLLIDAGVTYKQLNDRLATHSKTLDQLDGLLITHEHSDHTKGLPVLLKRINVPIYTAKKTAHALLNGTKMGFKEPFTYQSVNPYESFMINELIITPIEASHDAVSTLGYIIEDGSTKVVYLTDTGFVPKTLYTSLENADMYIFEANYDVTLLFTSERPYYLKKRIDSVKGHLSNADSAYHLTQLIGPKTKTLILAHPSDQCNTEHHALKTFTEVFKAYDLTLEDYEVHVAKQHVPSRCFSL